MHPGITESEVRLMKGNSFRESVFTFLNGLFFGTIVPFAAIGALATAFSLQLPASDNLFYRPLNLSLLLWYSMGFSLVFSLCFTMKKLWILVPIIVVGWLGYHWYFGELQECTFDLLYIISTRYDSAYGCGVLLLNPSRPIYSDISIAFRGFLIIGTALSVWATCKKQSSYWILLLSLLCFIPCCVITNTVPKTSFLCMWVFSILLFMMTNHGRKSDFQKSSILALLYAAPLTVGIILLFSFVPQQEYEGRETADTMLETLENLFSPSDSNSSGAGSKAQQVVDLADLGDRKDKNIPVMYITVPESGTYYLRGQVYTTYTGTQWIAEQNKPKLPWHSAYHVTDQMVSIRTRFNHEMLYVPYCANPNILSDGDLFLQNTDSVKEYAFDVYQPNLFLVHSLDSKNMALWLELPQETKQWAASYAPSQMSHFYYIKDTVQIVEDFVRNSATYDLSPDPMDPSYTDFVQWFIEEGESGYCVHFASAAAVLLRANGIPARYVTGYMVDAQANRETTVYERHAHGWVEYWTSTKGWQILEATPAGQERGEPTTEPEASVESTLPTTAEETPEVTEESLTTNTEPSIPATLPHNNQDLPVSGRESFFSKLWHILAPILKWIVIIGSFFAVIIGQRTLRLFLWNKKVTSASANRKALLYWKQSLRYSKLLNKKPEQSLKSLAEKAKFSNRTISRLELESFSKFFEKSQNTLKKQYIFRYFVGKWIFSLY